ncbi:MAG: DUF4382 domain-containing protein [Methanomicrobiales archaeon]|nr:DUF4382 domain-containing protein [Methanomicrobiales archaeon]
MKKILPFLLVLCLAGAFVLCCGCTQPVPPPVPAPPTPVPTVDPTACTRDAECVPAQCCHPTGCINERFRPSCTDVICTLECSGPLECGAGHCGCVDGTCQVIPGPAGQSTLIVAIKDAPKTTGTGTITELLLNISEVSVHRASAGQTSPDTDEEMEAVESDDTSLAGWTVVVNRTQTVDLLELTNVSRVLGQKTMDAGTYTQIRLKIDSGTITVDDTGYPLTVPSGVLKLNRGFVLEPDQTLTLTLDLNVDKSVIRTGSGQYMLKPVFAVISG